tara:strand:+ start:122 stop:349 length:228 start_codon:yes stop_codon:yes gene_type:complete
MSNFSRSVEFINTYGDPLMMEIDEWGEIQMEVSYYGGDGGLSYFKPEQAIEIAGWLLQAAKEVRDGTKADRTTQG